ncbi:PST family polysaccharide transporter [Agromyces terreus]|uniref:PST family polysaccharide transporter n=1 Tax=Agromyces terreus TaxID=424795 RepID=A0A9X2H3L6_9MICO|nr:lipopolysaccharide biosynthesis protein [Agromyces terreus]MCP2369454.1 PST family polysaccharide transporter [Agromyces terreus]
MTEVQDPPAPSLGASASRGALATMGGQGVRLAIQLAGIVVLARLLTPADYGLIAMVTAIIGVGEIFRDFGLSSAAIQAKTVSRQQKDNLFWLNTGIGLALTLLVCGLSGVIAGIYGDERLQLLTVALSATFLLNGISTQFRADLTRKLQFLRLAMVDSIAQAVGLAAGVVFALLGFGYWALAAQQLAICVIALTMLVVLTGWFPGWIHRRTPMRAFLGFGANLLGSQLLGYAAANVDSVVIGARFGATALGFYNRAFQLMMLPLMQLNAPSTRVALPVLSRLQDQRERFAAFISFGQSILLMAVSFTFAFLGAQAPSVVELALGRQWLEVVPLFQVLLVAGFFQASSYAVYWVMLAKGLARENLHYALATRPAMILLIVLGANWGVGGVAVAYTASIVLIWPVGLLWISRVSDAPAKAMFLNGVRMLLVFGFGAGVSWLSTFALPADAIVLRLVVGLASLIGWVVLVALIWPRFRADLVTLAQARRHFGSRRTP